jgi:hypothetical protein
LSASPSVHAPSDPRRPSSPLSLRQLANVSAPVSAARENDTIVVSDAA